MFSLFRKDKHKKTFVVVMTTIFVFMNLFGSLLFVRPAKAGLPVTVLESQPAIRTEIKTSISKMLLSSALGALVNGASYFMRKLAYDAAVYVAYGGKGQGALVFQKGASGYFSDLALNTAADAINTFAGDTLGLNICRPANLKFQVNLAIGLRSIYDFDPNNPKSGPQPSCTWQQLQAGAGSHWNQISNPSEVFSANLSVSQSDMGIALNTISTIDRMQDAAGVAAQAEMIANQGFKSLTGLISGNVKTPGQIVKTETEPITAKHQGELSAGQIAGIYGADALQVLPMAASVFTNTLVSTLLKRLLTEGLFSDKPSDGGRQWPDSGVTSFLASNLVDNRRAAQSAFSYLLTATAKKQMNVLDLVTQFATCDSNLIGINNCVIDTQFQEAIERSRTRPITIAEAIADNLLNRNLPLISPRREIDNQNVERCYQMGYCYSNIQKLRKARILPLGFEIAALKADPDHPETWTLGNVVDGFENCGKNYTSGDYVTPSEEYPFCHLIDPNWIIKAPETISASRVFGGQLIPGTADRIEEDVDWLSCVKEGEDGKCFSFGYCTKEKNIWQFGGDSCPSQFNTCQTFYSRNGVFSYLSRTLDYGECSVESLGCRAYSTEMSAGEWQTSVEADNNLTAKELGRSQVLYFNEKVNSDSCSYKDDGCTAFYKAEINQNTGAYFNNYNDARLVNLKKAPAYLNCYDINPNTDEIDWPKTKQDLNYLSTDESCEDFAQVCLPAEVGCQAYTPVSGGPTVPGVVGGNFCGEICAGYDTYKQESTNFAPAVDPLYFVPDLATECSVQHAGCDEFVNLSETGAGGETLEYYYDLKRCEEEDYENQGTFYSWEGSASEGYILRVHKLKTIDEMGIYNNDILNIVDGDFEDGVYIANQAISEYEVGSPAYVETRHDILAQNYSICNQTGYNIYLDNVFAVGGSSPDCRALYDREGNVFYRLLNDTVTISPLCHDMRKTEIHLYVDNSITNSNSCKQIKGSWSDPNQNDDVSENKCQRCYNGGEFSEGFCIYKTITFDSGICPATANGCRAYVGNTGNNMHQIFRDEFEPEGETIGNILQYWSPDSLGISIEALQVGLHSLKIDVDRIERTIPARTLSSRGWYELSFWARGVPQNLDISLQQVLADSTTTGILFTSGSTIGNEWREYRFGPVQFPGVGSVTSTLVFNRSIVGTPAQSLYFIDNLRLTELQDRVYKIKESWQTAEGWDAPLACDIAPYDPFPGEALGCKEYRDSDNQTVYLTGFEKLCREKAVGCIPLFDTYNTIDERRVTAYNLICNNDRVTENCQTGLGYCHSSSGDLITPEQVCGLDGSQVSNNCEAGNICKPLASCFVFAGDIECRLPSVVVPAGYGVDDLFHSVAQIKVDRSTVIVPADTSSTEPIYLTNYSDYRCNKLGCQKVGAEEQILPNDDASSFEFFDTYIVNDPEKYNETLCRDDLVGCESFTAGQESYFFRNPLKTGNQLCYYKPYVPSASDQYGWYMKDVGYCYDESGKVGEGQLCGEASDCASGQTCREVGEVPCYEDYFQAGGEYGIWSSGSDDQYVGMVGLCDAKWGGCSEFVDPDDTSQNYPDGQPYYVIYNQKLEEQQADCNEGVSLKEGCVLFDKTDEPKKIYSTALTYDLSRQKGFGFVPAQSGSLESGVDNDTNIYLKVERDRECAEWLTCQSWYSGVDQFGNPAEICYQLGRCDKTLPNLSCVHWIDKEEPLLSESVYINRDTSWGGATNKAGLYNFNEYSGYSLFNKFQIGDLGAIDIELDDKSKKTYLSYQIDNNATCVEGKTANGRVCAGDKGICYEGYCNISIDDSQFDLETGDEISLICKVHPEQSSPFDPEIVKGDLINDLDKKYNERTSLVSRLGDYQNANYCQNGDCSCKYEKVTYQNTQVDYGLPGFATWEGILEGSGDSSGNTCDKNQTGCSIINKKEIHQGVEGFCLEWDLSRPILGSNNTKFACLTWLPLDVAGAGVDNYNYDQKAGYFPAEDFDAPNGGGQVYCTDSTGAGYGVYDSDRVLPGVERGDSLYTIIGNIFYLCSSCPYSPESGSGGLRGTFYIYDVVNSIITNTGKPYLCNGTSEVYASVRYKLSQVHPFMQLNLLHYENFYSYRQYFHSMIQTWAWGGANQFYTTADGTTESGNQCRTFEFGNETNYENPYNLVYLVRDPRNWINYAKDNRFSLGDYSNYTYPNALDNYKYPGKIYEKEINKIRIAPFVLPYQYSTEEVSGGVITGDIKIDIDEMSKQGSSSCSQNLKTAISDVVCDVGVVNDLPYEALDDVSILKYSEFTSYTSDGQTKWLEIKDGNASIIGNNGKYPVNKKYYIYRAPIPIGSDNKDTVRYVLVYPLKYGISMGEIDEVVKNGFDHNYEMTATPHYRMILIDFAMQENGEVGYLKGYDSRGSFKSDKGKAFMPYDIHLRQPDLGVVIDLKPRCTELSSVVGGHGGLENKAWTDRVWQSASNMIGDDLDYPLINKITKNGELSPYGSTYIDYVDLTNVDTWWPYSIGADYGVPFACNDSILEGMTRTSFLVNNGDVCFGQPDNYYNNYPNSLSRNIKRTTDNIYDDNIYDLFVKVYKIVSRSGGEKKIRTSSGQDKAYEFQTAGYPPRVFSINPATCPGENCLAGDAHNITINDFNYVARDYDDDSFVDQDKNSDGLLDPLVGIAFFNAKAEFFAWADHNRMPIKKVMVKWGDGYIQNEFIEGSYKNRKPYCNNYECTKSSSIPYVFDLGLTCELDGGSGLECSEATNSEYLICASYDGHFGNQADRACQKGFFSFNHTYICAADDIGGGDYWRDYNSLDPAQKKKLANMGYTDRGSLLGGGVCVFKPAVQVRDNWGYCNSSIDPDKGNYGVELWGNYSDEETDNCDSSGAKPWTYYKGEIVVVPID